MNLESLPRNPNLTRCRPRPSSCFHACWCGNRPSPSCLAQQINNIQNNSRHERAPSFHGAWSTSGPWSASCTAGSTCGPGSSPFWDAIPQWCARDRDRQHCRTLYLYIIRRRHLAFLRSQSVYMILIFSIKIPTKTNSLEFVVPPREIPEKTTSKSRGVSPFRVSFANPDFSASFTAREHISLESLYPLLWQSVPYPPLPARTPADRRCGRRARFLSLLYFSNLSRIMSISRSIERMCRAMGRAIDRCGVAMEGKYAVVEAGTFPPFHSPP